MKNLYKIFLGLVVVLVTTVSCTKVELEDPTPSIEEATDTFRVVTAVPLSETKVDVDGLTVTWNESDKIAIAEVGEDGEFVTYYTYYIDEETISENGKYAEFTGSNLTVGKSYIAYNYLYYGYISSYSSYGITKNFFCSYGYSSFDKDNIDLVMQSNIFEYDGESLPQLYFETKSSLLELDIQLTDGCEYSGEVKSLEITSSASENIFLSTPVFNSYGESVYAFDINGYGYQAYDESSIELELTENIEFNTSASITLQVPLTWNGYITEANGEFVFTIRTADGKECTVTKPMKILEDGVRYTAELIFDEPQDMVASDRAALIDLYISTDGDNWTTNTNWCTDADLSEWYGVTTNSDGRVTEVSLSSNNLSGSIPESIGNLSNLSYLYLYSNSLTGSIPESIGNLSNLSYLSLSSNSLTGSIPESIGNLENIRTCYLYYNNLSGVIPESLSSWHYWPQLAWHLVQNSGYGFTSFPDVYLEPSTVTTIEGKTINTEDFFSYNELTCVVLWRSWCGYSTYYMSTIKDLYSTYASKGFGLISLNDEDDLSTITTYVSNNSIPGHVCQLSGYDYSDGTNRIKYMPTSSSPTYAFVDSSGKIVFSESLYEFDDPTMSRKQATTAFLENYFDESSTSTEKYESTDYSSDGEVMTLQTATVGDGIDLVIVGDGFIDTDMETGGEYETRMQEAMNHFFSEEPYTTYRNRYNVYAVKAVSKNSGVDGVNDTVFSCQFGEGTLISGDDTTVFAYALKVPSITNTNNLTVISVLNSSNYAGTCYMYTNDAAIAYCPIIYNTDENFRQIIIHEAGGHGFAKLLDEYAYTGTIPDDRVAYFNNYEKAWGWGANVDVVSDPSTIQWADLLADSRYSGLVGIYEGSMTYEYGAYRPTDVSIMRYNTGGYNPPSRKEIYRRIMMLSGDTYDYEEFVSYDAINRSVSSQAYSASQAAKVDKSTFVPFAQPVVINGSPKVGR